jgi:hypothetical protein
MTPDRPTPHRMTRIGCMATASGLMSRSSDVLVDLGLAQGPLPVSRV